MRTGMTIEILQDLWGKEFTDGCVVYAQHLIPNGGRDPVAVLAVAIAKTRSYVKADMLTMDAKLKNAIESGLLEEPKNSPEGS